jgi:hypothetical protein
VKKLIGYCNRQPPKNSEVPASSHQDIRPASLGFLSLAELKWRAFYRSIGVLRLSGDADDQALSRCFDDLLSDSFQGIDRHQAGNLR